MMDKEIYEFKSCEDFFKFEKDGCKNNTVRKIDVLDERFHGLIREWKFEKYSYIRIVHTQRFEDDMKASIKEPNQSLSFVRKINHIAIYGSLMIISWEHNGVE